MAQFSGTAGADLIRTAAAGGSLGGLPNATDEGDMISGGAGADTIASGLGFDFLFGGDGDDVLSFTGSGGFLSGEQGNDSLVATGFVTLLGSTGNDTLVGSHSLHGGSDQDLLIGADSIDSILGGSGNDTVIAGGGDDYIDGGSGNDSIEAGNGNDRVIGFDGADLISGGEGNDAIDAGDGSDTLHGGIGNDTVMADYGFDYVSAGRGFDRLDGGGDFDTLDFSTLGAGARVVLSVIQSRVVKHFSGGVMEVDVVQNFENFIGTAGHDRFTGWGQDETFTGGAGNDTIDGGDGFDTVRYDVAGVGNVHVNLSTGIAFDGLGGRDVLRRSSAGNNSIEMVIAGGGNDTLIGDDDGNWLRGGNGADSIDGGNGLDLADYWGDADLNADGFGIVANLGQATIAVAAWGLEGTVTVAGGTARDASGSIDTLVSVESLRGTAMHDRLMGSDGENFFRAMQGADTIDGGLGADWVSHRSDGDLNGDGFGAIVNLSSGTVTLGGWGAESLPGGLSVAARTARDGWGNLDSLTSIEHASGSMQNDLLVAATRIVNFTLAGLNFYGETRSFLRGQMGNDTLRGISGADGATADYRDDISGVTVNLAAGTAEDGWGFIDTLVNVTGASGSMFDDLLIAGAGGAFLRGRAGDDTLQGGAGLDTANYNAATGQVVVNLATGFANDGEGGTDSLIGIENASGGAFADSLMGNAGANLLFGGRGADTIDGGDGQDIASYYATWEGFAESWHNGVLVNLATGSARDGDGSPDGGSLDQLFGIEHVIGSFGADTLLGNTLANTLVGAEGDDSLGGGAANDTLVGGLGNDTLDGGVGIDLLDGGAGDDLILVGAPGDVVVEAVGGGADTVESTAAAYVLAAGVEVEVLTLAGAASTRATGNAFANILIGNSGANTLDGAAGDDRLEGGAGSDVLIGTLGGDTLTGGTGADQFRLASATHSYRGTIDRITDLEVGLDDIVLSGAANALFAGLDPAAIAFNGVVAIASAALGTGATTYAAVMSGLNTALGGPAGVTASSTATGLQTWQLNVLGGTAAGTYVFINDTVAGASSSTDMLIAVDLVGGPALSAADFQLL